MQELKAKASKSRTAKYWVENLILPVLLMLIFIRAEQEGEWALHLWAVNEMIPHFFAARHIHYARYDLIYLRSVQKLHGGTLERFQKREHVQRLKQGLWNGIRTDIIETNIYALWARARWSYWKTLNEKAVHRWAMSLHISSRLMKDLI